MQIVQFFTFIALIIFSVQASADIGVLFSGKSSQYDLNGDGVNDYYVKIDKENNKKVMTFSPSWEKSAEVIIEKFPNYSIRKIYQKNVLLREIRREEGLQNIVQILSNYISGKPNQKEVHIFHEIQGIREVIIYKRSGNKWSFVKNKNEKVETHISELATNDKSESWCDEFYSPAKYIKSPDNSLSPLTRRTNKNYLYTKVGLRINLDNCTEQAIEVIGKALESFRTEYIPCLNEIRPNLTADLIKDLWEYEGDVNCKDVKENTAADTHSRIGARINIFGYNKTTKHFQSNGLANTFLHEILHHHLEDNKYHSRDVASDDEIEDKSIKYDDAVYGCTEICEYKINGSTTRLTQKGCEECYSTNHDSSGFFSFFENEPPMDKKDAVLKCLQHPLIADQVLCQEKTGSKDCSEGQLEAFRHPSYSKCESLEAKYKIKDMCKYKSRIDLIINEKFDDCFDTLEGIQKGKGKSCLDGYIDLYNTPKFNKCLANYGYSFSDCRSGKLLEKQIHPDCTKFLLGSERKQCMYRKYPAPAYEHHQHTPVFGHPYRNRSHHENFGEIYFDNGFDSIYP